MAKFELTEAASWKGPEAKVAPATHGFEQGDETKKIPVTSPEDRIPFLFIKFLIARHVIITAPSKFLSTILSE